MRSAQSKGAKQETLQRPSATRKVQTRARRTRAARAEGCGPSQGTELSRSAESEPHDNGAVETRAREAWAGPDSQGEDYTGTPALLVLVGHGGVERGLVSQGDCGPTMPVSSGARVTPPESHRGEAHRASLPTTGRFSCNALGPDTGANRCQNAGCKSKHRHLYSTCTGADARGEMRRTEIYL